MMNPRGVILSFHNGFGSGESGFDLLAISVFIRQSQILLIGFSRISCQNLWRLRLDCVLGAHDMRQDFVLNDNRARGVLGEFRRRGCDGGDG